MHFPLRISFVSSQKVLYIETSKVLWDLRLTREISAWDLGCDFVQQLVFTGLWYDNYSKDSQRGNCF